jgi:Xaa-Pro aminopeptidase
MLPIEENFVDKIYKEKVKNTVNSFYGLDKKVAGESINSKISRVIKEIKSNNIENIFISSSENVAWLLNLRGRDAPNSPIPNCKIILTDKKKIFFFSCPKKIIQIKRSKKYKDLIFSDYKNFSKIVYKLRGKNFCIDNISCSLSNESIIKKSFEIKLRINQR